MIEVIIIIASVLLFLFGYAAGLMTAVLVESRFLSLMGKERAENVGGK